ncbi:9417_t:CDS:2 [Gigaspora rosea]|nr:9417_t:CDS:2 [Gigaspora rosea]
MVEGVWASRILEEIRDKEPEQEEDEPYTCDNCGNEEIHKP